MYKNKTASGSFPLGKSKKFKSKSTLTTEKSAALLIVEGRKRRDYEYLDNGREHCKGTQSVYLVLRHVNRAADECVCSRLGCLGESCVFAN